MKREKNVVGSKEKDEIWIPNIVFDNSIKELHVKNDEFAILRVNRNGTGYYSINDELQENLKYNGTTNNLIFSRNYKMNLICEFEQHNYPFDYQICPITVIYYTYFFWTLYTSFFTFKCFTCFED